MIDDPDVRFQESLKSIFRHERIVSVSLHGYAGNRTVNTQITRLAVSHLRLEQIGKSLALDLYCFHHLKRLHLTTDCRDETLPDPKHWHIPPALWATLETFVLEIYGWQPHAEVVVQAVADSVKVAGSTILCKLGILLNVAGYSDRTLLETFTQTSPNIDCLAIVVPELPHAVDIEKLALICPKLRELTLCAHLMSGTWKWPDTLHDYAVAFSKLPCLEKLALNHDDAAVDLDNPDESHLFGKFSINCTQESAALRLDFCRHLANSCLSLTDIAFCPFEQKQSCIRVERIEDTVAEVGFTDNCGKFCWEAF